MKFRISALLVAILFVAASTRAQPPPRSALLYKITGKSLKKPSYLFGTMHIVCDKDLAFAQKLTNYLVQTEQMMLEMDLDDPDAIKKVTDAAMPKDGKSLKDQLTQEDYKKLDDLYKSHLGFSVELLDKLSPTMVSTFLFTSPKIIGCAKPARLDRDLAEVAKLRNNEVIGLESVDEQLALINSTPIADQIKALKQLTAEPDKFIQDFQNMYKVYLSQNSDSLYEIISKEMSAQSTSKDAFLDQRNQNWVPLIERQIASKPTFVAFGAGHLGGKKGVVALLRARGYVVTPIRL